MRILLIPNYMYPHIGGIEQVNRDIADSLLASKDVEMKIICFNGDAKDGDYVCHQKETVVNQVDGIEVHRCGCFTKVASQSLSLTYPRELKKLFQEFLPDKVVFHYPNPFVASFLLPLVKKRKDIEFILYWHLDITKQKLLGKLFNGQTETLLKRADRIVATSPNYIEGSPFLIRYRDKCTVIPNCIREDRLAPSSETVRKVEEIRNRYLGKTICFAVGRHVPYKGIEYLVRASKKLDDRFAVLIGGKGPLTDSLKAMAADDKKVEFLGRVSDEDLKAYFAACDILCFPSITKNEAFGISLAEGMYAGKPAITFTVPGSGINYVSLDGVTGFECPNGDVEAFANAMKKVADEEELRAQYGCNAKKRVEELFLFSSFRKSIQEFFRV